MGGINGCRFEESRWCTEQRHDYQHCETVPAAEQHGRNPTWVEATVYEMCHIYFDKWGKEILFILISYVGKLDIHVSVHHDIIYKNDQQDATV